MLLPLFIHAQISNFDLKNDDWQVEGDAQNKTGIPLWLATDGNPGGHLYAKDDGTGGIWYWVAPKKYLGQKCYAYGQKLSFDLRTNTLDKQFDNKDLIIAGGGMILYYDLLQNPGLTWTHYEVTLDETDNWSLNSFPNGPKPTKQQMFQVLSNVTAFKIRGEYSGAIDAGDLDNVSMGGYAYLDLDGDDSSGGKNGDYVADTICGRTGKVTVKLCDDDVSLDKMDNKVDSVTFFGDNFVFKHQFFATPSANIVVKNAGTPTLTLVNKNGKADTTEFKNVLQSVRAEFDLKDYASSFDFLAQLTLPDLGKEYCVLLKKIHVIIRQKDKLAALNDTVLCGDAKAIRLNSLLKNNQDTTGFWLPKTNKKGIFSPKIDKKGVFTYVLPALDQCPSDSLKLKIDLLELPQNVLGRDTIICKDSSMVLDVSRYGYDTFVWSNGTNTPTNVVSSEGKYWLTMSKKNCAVSDSINIGNINCNYCDFYVPNSFSPNEDGINDRFEVFSECEKIQAYSLVIYDRWGNLIFQSDDVTKSWDGTYKGRPANVGIYTYSLKTTTEYRAKPFEAEKKGGVMLVR